MRTARFKPDTETGESRLFALAPWRLVSHSSAPTARTLESSVVYNANFILHPAGHAHFGIGERSIERSVAPAAFPDDAALIQNPDERTGLAAVADLDGSKLSGPSPEMRIRC